MQALETVFHFFDFPILDAIVGFGIGWILGDIKNRFI